MSAHLPGRTGRLRRTPARLAALCCAALACAGVRSGASDSEIAAAIDKSRHGWEIFTSACASCHGHHGEGLADTPAVLGPGALAEYPRALDRPGVAWRQDPQQMEMERQTRHTGLPWRDPFHNADDVHTYLREHLSRVDRSRAGSLKADDYWAVVGFLFAAQGADLPPEGITAQNARSIPVPKR